MKYKIISIMTWNFVTSLLMANCIMWGESTGLYKFLLIYFCRVIMLTINLSNHWITKYLNFKHNLTCTFTYFTFRIELTWKSKSRWAVYLKTLCAYIRWWRLPIIFERDYIKRPGSYYQFSLREVRRTYTKIYLRRL